MNSPSGHPPDQSSSRIWMDALLDAATPTKMDDFAHASSSRGLPCGVIRCDGASAVYRQERPISAMPKVRFDISTSMLHQHSMNA
jgi:hypothetical protein